MNKKTSIKDIFSETRETFEHALDGAILQFTNRICEIMKQEGISKNQLAKRMGCSPPYITKLFRGNPNLTVASMVKMAAAVHCEIAVLVRPKAVRKKEFRRVPENCADTEFRYSARDEKEAYLVLSEKPSKTIRGKG